MQECCVLLKRTGAQPCLCPTQLLDAMMALFTPGEPPGIIFQALCLQRLPANMKDHLVAANLETPREMAATTDRMWDSRTEGHNRSVHGVSPAARGHHLSPCRRVATPGLEGLCFYHSCFATKAHRCEPPCTWSGPMPAGNSTDCFSH